LDVVDPWIPYPIRKHAPNTIAGFQVDDDDNNNNSVDGEEEQTTIAVPR
jgi:hypothetical protein